jgi:hypothetical protein
MNKDAQEILKNRERKNKFRLRQLELSKVKNNPSMNPEARDFARRMRKDEKKEQFSQPHNHPTG